mmetsp:Transcript_105853/g.306128  ORF Transcript_105853/g.306128 Transcript_105853/m.306128 type:complete len:169 (-) Transcript_105853:680-1186(-)
MHARSTSPGSMPFKVIQRIIYQRIDFIHGHVRGKLTIRPSIISVTPLSQRLTTSATASRPCTLVFGLNSFDDVWAEVTQGDWSLVGPLLRSYAVCGTDAMGRSIMWIQGGGIKPEDEAVSVRAGVLYFMAIHADNTSMHEGITFVIDTSKNDTRYGNEKQLQRVWQVG